MLQVSYPTELKFYFESLTDNKILDFDLRLAATFLISGDQKLFACGVVDDLWICSFRKYSDFQPDFESVKVCKIKTGAEHMLVLDDKGEVYGHGSNECKQLGKTFGRKSSGFKKL